MTYSMDPINEDTVQCLFFSRLSITDILEETFWSCLCEEINKTIQTLSQEYIWHRDEFKLNIPIVWDKSHNDIPLHLTSVTCFGDNIEDEWFIVYLVLEITKIYSDVIVQIKDNDGDFILIEAADYLPEWANPDTTVNRVFLYNGHIHLIPPEVVNLETDLNISDALKIILQSPERTEVVANIEEAVLERIGNYPYKINENIHETVINIPAELAALLTLEPNLIAPIVTTYCSHDPLEAKACRNIPINDCIETKVKFTKCLYSMLVHSKLINNVYSRKNDANGTIIGLKLAFGFYIILKSSKDIFSTRVFANFLASLKDKGYFKGNIEGSQEYNKLLGKAKNYFLSNECSINLNVCNKIKQLMSTDEFVKLKETLIANNGNSNLSGDSDDWLNINPDHLNELLNKRYGKEVKYKNNDVVTAQTITDDLCNFLNKSSDFEGVETNINENLHKNSIEFQADKFSECIENVLNLLLSNNDEEIDAESDISDGNDEFSDADDALDQEIRTKLSLENNYGKSQNVLKNIIQSMKEEKSSPGPSSTLLKSVGIDKNDILDSDDDDDDDEE